jgi:BRCT domain type II-containing protein
MLDCQKGSGKAIFGGGYLISDKVKAEREKAEREKAEREKAEREKAERENAERWELSEREKEIIKTLK